MAEAITRLLVDVDNEKLILSATPNNDDTYHYRFTDIYIDTSVTFNCSNGESSNAYHKSLSIEDADYDKPLGNDTGYLEIPFSNILSDDVSNDILFIWIEENKYNASYEEIKDDTDYPKKLFGITLSVKTLYELIINNINIKKDGCCNVGCSEVNTMLAWQGFNLAKNLGQYKRMIYFWKILHKTINTDTSKCHCNK